MSVEMKVPNVGESINEVTLAQWVKKDGDYVEMDEVIAELESDKASFDLSAEAAGVLHTKIEEGDTVEVGELICEIDTDAKSDGKDSADKKKEEKEKDKKQGEEDGPKSKKKEEAEDAEEEKDSKTKKESDSSGVKTTGEIHEMKIPTVGESISEVTLGSWIKSDGDFVDIDEPIAEIESDKASFELTAEAQGILRLEAEEGDTLEIGDLVCKIEVTEGKPEKGEEEKKKSKDKAEATEDKKEAEEKEDVNDKSKEESYAFGHASPAAIKILKEKGLDPDQVNGSGKDGRITKEDALTAEKKKSPEKADKIETKEAEVPEGGEPKGKREQERKRMSSLRKTVAKRLVSVKNETAMLTTFNEVDMKPIMDIRKEYKEQFKEKYEVGLGFMSFFAKACCLALEEWPAVNAYLDGEEIVYNHYCDISIAVSTPRGLVVPVVRNAESRSFAEIEKEIIRLAGRARENKITIEEMTGGTFTITNGGVFGSMLSTPIINAPQSAILGMHNIVERPVAKNGEVAVRPIMYIALSYDHRIIDGRESVSFLVRLKELLEDPTRLLLGI